jgi:hypothetical protein
MPEPEQPAGRDARPEDGARELSVPPARSAPDEDPVLRLLGTIRCGVSDVAERHDCYIGQQLLAELRGDVE